ncbi:unnamed protein product [Blepharisma stoltei]|uniref:Uncharacterized protein n=1 Tax=Blepharisma stoltei TaxID=1481888 RepID=A0AAU9JF34_9CILI|nr:unnamed protein product [Blepharisma stoltei]
MASWGKRIKIAHVRYLNNIFYSIGHKEIILAHAFAKFKMGKANWEPLNWKIRIKRKLEIADNKAIKLDLQRDICKKRKW